MIDEREIVRVAVELLSAPEPSYERLVQRRDRKRRNQWIAAGVVGMAVFVAAVWIVTSGLSFDRSETAIAPDRWRPDRWRPDRRRPYHHLLVIQQRRRGW